MVFIVWTPYLVDLTLSIVRALHLLISLVKAVQMAIGRHRKGESVREWALERHIYRGALREVLPLGDGSDKSIHQIVELSHAYSTVFVAVNAVKLKPDGCASELVRNHGREELEFLGRHVQLPIHELTLGLELKKQDLLLIASHLL